MPDYYPGPLGPERGTRFAESNTSQVTACHRCRKQKLRCSREIPSCKRCQDISASCSYPPPPDRKLLAAQRAQNAKARSLQESRNAAAQRDFVGAKFSSAPREQSPTDVTSGQLPNISRTNHERRSLSGGSPGVPMTPMTLLQVAFPPEELALKLIDIYFSHQYNSTLLFHKQTLARDYLAGRVPDYVALSIFALGAVFLAVSKGQSPSSNHSIAGSHRPGEDWASAASQKALMHCDQPRYEVVQACQTLAMYWFAVGQTDRTNMHHHIAYRTCRLLGYNNPTDTASSEAFSAELRRRAFWASWSMGCLSQNNASFKNESWREAIGLPLPCDEASFAACQPVLKEAFDDEGHLALLDDQPELARISYMGEIVKLLSVWWEISTFAKRFVHAGPLDSLKRMSQLQDFDQQLDTVRENLHPSFQYKDITSFSSRETSHNYQLFAVRVLYHLCVCTLHSSIVPVFSNIPPDARISRKLTRMSANEAVRHSQALISLATDLLGVHSDKSRCPSFTGYAMFMAVSIQFKSLGAQGLLRGDCIGSLYPAISILECLKGVWRTQGALWKILESLFSGAGLNINNLSDTRQLLALPDRNLNLDEIASHGVMHGSADIYTYVADEEPRSGLSQQTSPTASRGDSPIVQLPTSFRRPPANKTKPEENYRPTLAGSAPQHMRVHAEHHTPQMFWPAGQIQIHDANQGASSSHHDRMLSPIGPFQFKPAHSGGQTVPGSETGSGPSFQTQASDMGYMGVDISMGVDNMDLDTSGVNLWWDQPFDAIPAHQYGWWQAGGYDGPTGDAFYPSYGHK